jgi:hypothetical protein
MGGAASFHGLADLCLFHGRLNDRPADVRDLLLYRETHHHLLDGFIVPAYRPHPRCDLRLIICIVLFAMYGLQSHR